MLLSLTGSSAQLCARKISFRLRDMSSTMRPALRIENPGHVAASTITLDYEQNRNSLWMYGVSETSPIPLRGPHPCMFVVSVRKKTYGKLCEILRINTPNMP